MRHDDFAVLFIFSIVRLNPSLEKSFLGLKADLFHVKHINMAILFHVEQRFRLEAVSEEFQLCEGIP